MRFEMSHAFIYMKEQKRTDVHVLTLMDHQRMLPPLDGDKQDAIPEGNCQNDAHHGGDMTEVRGYRFRSGLVRYYYS